MTALSIVGVNVRQDSEGRFSLNDLHKAAVAKGKANQSQRPANFLKSEPVKAFIAELDSDATQIASVESVKGGKNQGTYASELVAIRYAGWIDPSFEITVYRTFQAVAKGEIEQAKAIATRQTLKDEYLPMTDAVKNSKLIEGKAPKAYHFSNENNMIYRVLTGMDAKKYKSEHGVESVRDSLTPVEQQCLLSLQRANTSLIDLGYDYQHRKEEMERLYQRLWMDKLTEEHIRLEA